MADVTGAPTKGTGAWGQAVLAVALVGALGVGLWTVQETSSADSVPPPATCSGGEPEKATGKPGKAPWRVSGAQLCEALNRPGLAEVLGTPGETVKSASGNGGSLDFSGAKEIDTPSAQVEFGTYTVTLSATYDGLPVDGSATLLGADARQQTFLGRPAVIYSQRTISISFRLDGSDSESGPGAPARVLSVAQDAKDGGGSFEVAVWRTDGMTPDDAVLLRVAEKVLPTVPRWADAG
ncbi:DUF6215 domain-containing protein [Streptomyces sp. NBC_00683]|uniref:DUF6215 domain-containing protein n=1 Tax=Streptomyces sp. NBC_00683 TaxID=2903670 RepID=UPI002E37F29A|nr:DUF6215 domain-containing protein [Streptomyces sp. NBC_00683]